jgi:hypothetical protein
MSILYTAIQSKKRKKATLRQIAIAVSLAVAGQYGVIGSATAADASNAVEVAPTPLTFGMVRSTAAVGANCLVGARARVTVEKLEGVERMTIVATGLPPHTGFDLFVIQVPDFPFGMSWYQGDMESNASGTARGVFRGRFNIETFIVAPDVAVAPRPHQDPPFPDASENPATAPVHTYHLGMWFDSPEAAAAAGCPDAVTPFNGDHTAGVQALSTRNFLDEFGPLRRIR